MASYKLLLLPGDGIGPEVAGGMQVVLDALRETGLATFETETDLVGGCALDAHGVPLADATLERARAADAILLGAVGGPKWAASPTSSARRPACCACARTSTCSPTCGRRSATRRWPRPRR